MTWGFLATYCDESYATLSHDWINKVHQQAANGLNLEMLETDLRQLTGTTAAAA